MIDLKSPVQPSLNGLNLLSERQFSVHKRDGRTVGFDNTRIFRALEKAFRADSGADGTLSPEVLGRVRQMTDAITQAVLARSIVGETLDVEGIQDAVEQQLMKDGYFSVARRYILYREERKKARALNASAEVEPPTQEEAVAKLSVTRADGSRTPLDLQRLRRRVAVACRGFEGTARAADLLDEVVRALYDGVTTTEIDKALILTAKSRIEREPDFSFVAARLLLQVVYEEALQESYNPDDFEVLHRRGFRRYLETGIQAERLDPRLLAFDLDRLSAAMRLERDHRFTYMGLQTIYDRYLIHEGGRRIETPQYFWMRVAMGLAMGENQQKHERAIEFYNVLSTFLFTSSTPTLFNAGTTHPQLSSCYLATVMDDLEHIFKVVSDDAKLSKWAGGLGNDWTNVRATGAYIKGTNGESQGVIPFLKVANDTAVAVNQGGKRKGAMCGYLETWHLDIEDFLELRRNTGDERRRTHDMNTANWIPDLFMKRVASGSHWTLFNPSDVPDLHHLYGQAFEKRYEEYERQAASGQLRLYKRVEALSLWRKMLSMLFETGHPWITFKDPSNLRSPQDHVGVVHCSNLCTEILLNTSLDEVAVCNLGSINLASHIVEGKLQEKLLARTVRTAVRMLDNVIDINYYPIIEARQANLRHRPIGLGIMGFQDALYKLDISYASPQAVDFADTSMEMISYYAILASSELAAERGPYPSYKGSKWSRGLMPIDTLRLLEEERGSEFCELDHGQTMDWEQVRQQVRQHGMRNSNTMAIAPTATISNISGVSQSIEPTFKNLYAKSNLSGEFTSINTYLVEDLKKLGLWDDDMLEDLKYYDGALDQIERLPNHIRLKYLTAFEVDPIWLVECASRRQKWIDMGQSLNLYIAEPSGKKLHEMYLGAWRKGLKTTYYLRSTAATQVEKSTVDINKRGIQPRWMKNKSASDNIALNREAVAETAPAVPAPRPAPAAPVAAPVAASPQPKVAAQAVPAAAPAAVEIDLSKPAPVPKACSLDNPECEACQ